MPEKIPEEKIKFKPLFPTEDSNIPQNRAYGPEIQENTKQADILDETGNTLCKIEYNPETGEILTILPEHYVNTEGRAENTQERIYVTDEAGNVTDERPTREEARMEQKRYLIVTSLLSLKDGRILIQKRSLGKKLDPGKQSISAHGVAKEIFSANQQRISDGQTAALVNTALEINEELRHDAIPFTIRVWHGTHDDLFVYAKGKKINDPNTVWLVPESYVPDGYPLHAWKNGELRTRAFSSAFIFCEKDPLISIDPSELEGFKWKTIPEALQDPKSAADLPRSAEKVIRHILNGSTLEGRYGAKHIDNMIKQWHGENIYSDKP